MGGAAHGKWGRGMCIPLSPGPKSSSVNWSTLLPRAMVGKVRVTLKAPCEGLKCVHQPCPEHWRAMIPPWENKLHPEEKSFSHRHSVRGVSNPASELTILHTVDADTKAWAAVWIFQKESGRRRRRLSFEKSSGCTRGRGVIGVR